MAQFTCIDLPIRNRSLYFGSSRANREFAYCVLNAKLFSLEE